MIKYLTLAVFILSSASSSALFAAADESVTIDSLDLSLTEQSLSSPVASSYPLRLAGAMPEASSSMASGDDMGKGAMAEKPMFKKRWFTANKTHQYLGLASIASAGIAVLMPKEEDGPHEEFAKAAAALGGAAVATGFAFHYGDLSFKNGMSNPDNLHALLGTLGALGFIAAVDEAPDSGHTGPGVAGAILMLGAIKITW